MKKTKNLKERRKMATADLEDGIHVDMDSGTAKFQGKCDHEPKSAEEIIKILKIDTTVWKLSSYWNKQMADHWRISALVTRIKNNEEVLIKKLIKRWKPKTYKIPKNKIPKEGKPTVCGILSLQDIHFGKEGNYTIDKDFEDTVINLITRGTASHHLAQLYYVVGMFSLLL